MTHDEIIAVVAAHRDGVAIQCASLNELDVWRDLVGNPVWNFSSTRYREKPEPPKPREWWIERIPGGETNLWTSRQSAVIGRAQEIIHVREVLPESAP